MALLIGGTPIDIGPRTWGSLRSIIFNATLSNSVTHGSRNIEYEHGFKTTEGNGFVRTDYSALYFSDPHPLSGPNFTAEAVTTTEGLFGSLYNFGGSTSSSGMLVNEDRLQLTGESVVLSSGTITISADAFIDPDYQEYSGTLSVESITSIGKLTAF
jgi:hypothetical protein